MLYDCSPRLTVILAVTIRRPYYMGYFIVVLLIFFFFFVCFLLWIVFINDMPLSVQFFSLKLSEKNWSNITIRIEGEFFFFF